MINISKIALIRLDKVNYCFLFWPISTLYASYRRDIEHMGIILRCSNNQCELFHSSSPAYRPRNWHGTQGVRRWLIPQSSIFFRGIAYVAYPYPYLSPWMMQMFNRSLRGSFWRTLEGMLEMFERLTSTAGPWKNVVSHTRYYQIRSIIHRTCLSRSFGWSLAKYLLTYKW